MQMQYDLRFTGINNTWNYQKYNRLFKAIYFDKNTVLKNLIMIVEILM